MILQQLRAVVTCQARNEHHEQAQKGKRPPHSSKRAWEGRAMLPKKKEKGPAYMEPTAHGRPQGPAWELLDVPDLLKRVAHKKTNFQYWLSINPAEQKQHVKIWVKRYPKDTGVPVPQACGTLLARPLCIPRPDHQTDMLTTWDGAPPGGPTQCRFLCRYPHLRATTCPGRDFGRPSQNTGALRGRRGHRRCARRPAGNLAPTAR